MITADLANFKTDLDQVRSSADAVISLGVAPSMLPVASSLSSALVVLLCGRFENFLKAVMKSFIEEVNVSYVPFSALPINLRLSHFRHGAKVLQESVPAARESNDFSYLLDLSGRLASVAEGRFEAAWEAFTNTNANPGPDTIRDLMKNIGLLEFWPKLKARTSTHGDLSLALGSFIAIRNECAHTGGSTSPLTPVDIIDYADMIEALSENLVALVLDHGATCLAA
jgi:hypothetical protein